VRRHERSGVLAGIVGAPLALAVASAEPVFGAGFSLYEQGARALGMAGAFAAQADDPSAIFFNPAGLAHLDDHELLISPNVIRYEIDFAGVAPYPGFGVTEETETKYFPPVAAYYAQGIAKKWAAGIGVYSPYGLEVVWDEPDTYTGKYISTKSRITPFYFVPTAAWAPTPELQIGAGVSVVLSHVELRRHLSAFNPLDNRTEDIGDVVLESEAGTGIGFNAGLQWWPAERAKFGITYRSEVDIDYSGPASFTQRPTGNPTFDAIVAASFPPDQTVATTVAFPAQGVFAFAFKPGASITLEADFGYTWWSSFDRLEVKFDQTPANNIVVDQAWNDVFNIRAGGEYRAGGTSPWAFRLGYYFDESPQPTESVGPLLPDGDRHGISAGAGWRTGDKSSFIDTVDLFVLGLIIPDRSTEGVNRDNYNGTYSPNTLVAGFSVGMNFR
jgi:long-chain fatty acid transport protein